MGAPCFTFRSASEVCSGAAWAFAEEMGATGLRLPAGGPSHSLMASDRLSNSS